MKIETQVTADDNIRMAFNIYYSRPAAIIIVVLGSLFLVTLLACLVQGIEFNGMSYFYLFLFGIVFLLTTPLILYFNTKKQYESNKSLQQVITYEFTEEKILLTSASISSDFPWENVYMVRETKSLFLIYQSRAVANLLPKRFFSAEEIIEFRDLAKRKVSKTKLRKK